MSIRKPAPSSAVKLIRATFMKSQGQEFRTKDAYELLAQLEGYKDWATANVVFSKTIRAPKPTPKLGYLRTEIETWPVYTVCMHNEGPDYDEVFYILPQGVKLEDRVKRYGDVDEAGAKVMPNIFDGQNLSAKDHEAKVLQTYVVTDTYSIVGRPEKYGLPHYANELGVADWAIEDLGWNYVGYDNGKGVIKSSVEVNFYDSGDDGAGRFWLQIAVEPSAAKLLEAALAKEETVDFDA